MSTVFPVLFRVITLLLRREQERAAVRSSRGTLHAPASTRGSRDKALTAKYVAVINNK